MRRAFAKLRVALCFTALSFAAPLTAAHYFERVKEVALELFVVGLRSFRCALVLVGTREGLFFAALWSGEQEGQRGRDGYENDDPCGCQ